MNFANVFVPTMKGKNMTKYTLTPFDNDLFFGTPWRDLSLGTAKPKIDIVNSNQSVTIIVDAPGYNAENVDITANDGVLTISGKRILEKNDENRTFTKRERTEEAFFRSFELDEQLDTNKIAAVLKNGVLQVDIPKKDKVTKAANRITVVNG